LSKSVQKNDQVAAQKKELIRQAEDKVFHYTNKERNSRGLKSFQPSEALKYLAERHSRNMCGSDKFKHESKAFPKGWETLPGRFKHIGVRAGAENIAYRTLRGKADEWARKIVKGWMKSKGHRKNILDPRFKYMGVGLVPCKELGYTTQVFAPQPGSKTDGRPR
jgi:uncharacterized protein YkwD